MKISATHPLTGSWPRPPCSASESGRCDALRSRLQPRDDRSQLDAVVLRLQQVATAFRTPRVVTRVTTRHLSPDDRSSLEWWLIISRQTTARRSSDGWSSLGTRRVFARVMAGHLSAHDGSSLE